MKKTNEPTGSTAVQIDLSSYWLDCLGRDLSKKSGWATCFFYGTILRSTQSDVESKSLNLAPSDPGRQVYLRGTKILQAIAEAGKWHDGAIVEIGCVLELNDPEYQDKQRWRLTELLGVLGSKLPPATPAATKASNPTKPKDPSIALSSAPADVVKALDALYRKFVPLSREEKLDLESEVQSVLKKKGLSLLSEEGQETLAAAELSMLVSRVAKVDELVRQGIAQIEHKAIHAGGLAAAVTTVVAQPAAARSNGNGNGKGGAGEGICSLADAPGADKLAALLLTGVTETPAAEVVKPARKRPVAKSKA